MQFTHYVSEHSRKADADNQLPEKTKIIALTRICPKEFTDRMIMDGVKIQTCADLETRLTNFKIAHRELDVIQGRSNTPMELGEIAVADIVKAVPQSESPDKFKAMQDKIDQMSAMIYQGKGGGNSNSGAWGSWKGGAGGRKGDSKGKGKGKGLGGKGGPTTAAVALSRAKKVPGGTPICDEYRRTGQCTFKSRTGRRCEFLHVDKIPAALSSIEGLISTDFKGVPMTCDWTSGVWTCGACTEQSASTIANLETAIEKAYEELVADYQCGEEAAAQQPFR